jgi:hypothetical protein
VKDRSHTRPGPSLLTESERSARLDREIDAYVREGYHLVVRTPTTAELVSPRAPLSALWLVFWLFVGFAVAAVIYVVYWALKPTGTVYLWIDEEGGLHGIASGTAAKDHQENVQPANPLPAPNSGESG